MHSWRAVSLQQLSFLLCSWPYPYSTLMGCSRWTRSPMLGQSEQVGLLKIKLNGREITFEVFHHVWKTYLNATDRQTDGRHTVAKPPALYHRALKTGQCMGVFYDFTLYITSLFLHCVSREFWIFPPNVIKIDPYNFELYRFKVGAFFETQCIGVHLANTTVWVS